MCPTPPWQVVWVISLGEWSIASMVIQSTKMKNTNMLKSRICFLLIKAHKASLRVCAFYSNHRVHTLLLSMLLLSNTALLQTTPQHPLHSMASLWSGLGFLQNNEPRVRCLTATCWIYAGLHCCTDTTSGNQSNTLKILEKKKTRCYQRLLYKKTEIVV